MIARIEPRQIKGLGARRVPRFGQQEVPTLEVRNA